MRITIIAGATRRESTSAGISAYIGRLIQEEGHEVTLFDLREKPVPLYNDDDEDMHPNTSELQDAVLHADAVVLSTPEYHGSISGVLKNALDYLGKDQFCDKAVLSVSSAGGAVGVSSLQHMQTIVRNVHGINSPEWISIGGAQRQFKPDGTPESADVQNRVHRTVTYFLQLAAKLRA
ncbi:NADPH-dependent FMN reductase [Paenibacillus sacheonensis]|uniref:NADPH-dependent FMN reductase n=1 Tax=Paenibacillus sacheonensis TaxID=742054 RepID=A0A7X4YNJ6_9BACL|nr:NADPH-dependent FMN reductase [Paenibacillus sacheonensis]MBM7565460.1 NAD(P)H-dependent FMN reductase [Paenibacillus sacheonensis]NBC69612.1 NADPH-dependent FMN reductase [Paenibacillus sacheonensis]